MRHRELWYKDAIIYSLDVETFQDSNGDGRADRNDTCVPVGGFISALRPSRLARGLVPFMRQRGGGVILNNASICSAQPLWYEPIYNVSKAALVMLSKTMANEFIPYNIRVNVVNAGLVLTPDWVKSATELTAGTDMTPQQYLDQVAEEHTPMKRFASPEEIANYFVFLCSPRASYIVGSSCYIDGGMLKVTK